MIEFMNENAGAVTGLATVALLIVTGFYAWTTHRLFNEAKTTRLLGGQPRIVAYMRVNEAHPTIAQMHLANISGAPAIGVSAKIEKITEWPDEFRLEDSKILRDLSFMRPHEVLMFDIGLGTELIRDGMPAMFRIKVNFHAVDGREYIFDSELKLESLLGFSRFGVYSVHDIAQNVGKISKTLEKIISFSRLQVDSYSSGDRRAEALAREEQEKRWHETQAGEEVAEGSEPPEY
jgi:hypothetical protein